MTLESMTELSLPRNEVIANLLGRFYPVDDAALRRKTLMDKRGEGVSVLLAESETLSGIRPVYELIEDLELKLTLFAALDIQRAAPVHGQDLTGYIGGLK